MTRYPPKPEVEYMGPDPRSVCDINVDMDVGLDTDMYIGIDIDRDQ